jgi:hypothetical protein
MTTNSATPGPKANQATSPTSPVGARKGLASVALGRSEQSDLHNPTSESKAALSALARLLGRQLAKEGDTRI